MIYLLIAAVLIIPFFILDEVGMYFNYKRPRNNKLIDRLMFAHMACGVLMVTSGAYGLYSIWQLR